MESREQNSPYRFILDSAIIDFPAKEEQSDDNYSCESPRTGGGQAQLEHERNGEYYEKRWRLSESTEGSIAESYRTSS